jgi:hypothetical protein
MVNFSGPSQLGKYQEFPQKEMFGRCRFSWSARLWWFVSENAFG